MKKIILCAVVLALVGCGSNPVKENCARADWKTMGSDDGFAGEPAETSTVRIRECPPLAEKANIDQYTAGYIEGIKYYCSYEGGKKAGEKGKPYKPGACPLELSKDFIKGYQEGRDQWEANRSMKQAQRGNHSVGG